MKKIATLLIFLAYTFTFGQNVNDYKYVLVPSKFDFNKEPNAYGLNTTTKALLEKYGFVAYMDNDPAMPDEIRNYNCNKLYADAIENNNITSTKLTIILKDCKGNVIFRSAEGKSRSKDWKVGYNEALREAGTSFDALGYKYNGSVTDIQREVVKTTNDGSSVKKEIVPVAASNANVLFAQPITNGFQLIDSAPKVVLKIFSTNSPSVFIAEKEAFKGVLRQENGNWILEYYNGQRLVSETLSIKF